LTVALTYLWSWVAN